MAQPARPGRAGRGQAAAIRRHREQADERGGLGNAQLSHHGGGAAGRPADLIEPHGAVLAQHHGRVEPALPVGRDVLDIAGKRGRGRGLAGGGGDDIGRLVGRETAAAHQVQLPGLVNAVIRHQQQVGGQPVGPAGPGARAGRARVDRLAGQHQPGHHAGHRGGCRERHQPAGRPAPPGRAPPAEGARIQRRGAPVGHGGRRGPQRGAEPVLGTVHASSPSSRPSATSARDVVDLTVPRLMLMASAICGSESSR